MQNKIYSCLNCKNVNTILKKSYPFNTVFNNKNFFFLKCSNCKITSIYPKLTSDDIEVLYDFKNYHLNFYNEDNVIGNNITFNLLKKYIDNDARVLDYGCGNGSLLNKIHKYSKNLYGVDVYNKSKKYSINFKYYNTNLFKNNNDKYDLIILRDVTEHLNDPLLLISKLSNNLSENGILYIEGPLEKGLSLVNLCIHLYGNVKRLFPLQSTFKPYHLSYFSINSKIKLISKLNYLKVIKVLTYETGWPYDNAGIIKNFISKLSKFIYFIFSLKFFNIKYGNRFILILKNEK